MTSRWRPRDRMLLGFALTGLIVTMLQLWITALPDENFPDSESLSLFFIGFFFVIAAVISGWISWRALRDERRAERTLRGLDAASGPLAVTLLFGLPLVALTFTWRSLIIVSVGLVLSAVGYCLSALWRGNDPEPDDVQIVVQPLADDDDPPLVTWRVTLRRGFFLLVATFLIAVAVVLIYLPPNSLQPFGSALLWIRGAVFTLYLGGVPMVLLTLAMLQDDVHSTWRRFFNRVGAVNLVALPFGLIAVAVVSSTNWVYGLSALATLITGSLALHPLALLWEQSTAKDDRVARATAAIAARAWHDAASQARTNR